MIVDGQPRGMLNVTTWHEHGLTFVRPFRTETRMVVLHWTGGRGQREQVHRTLRAKDLSVQFLIESDGTIVQYTDAQAHCSHARSVNAYSVGIEVVGPVGLRKHFEPRQVQSIGLLLRTLCGVYGLPYALPSNDRLPHAALATYRGVVGHYHVRNAEREREPHLGIKVDPGRWIWGQIGL